MPQVKSEGIILKSVTWKEQSKIVTLFSSDFGRQSIIDRGGHSLKSKRGRLLTFSRLELVYFKSEKSGMGYITEVDPIETFGFEKEGTLGRLTYASAALEILYDLLPDDEPQEVLYSLTCQYFKYIDQVPKAAVLPVFLGYFLKTLSYLGYRPNFNGCIGCNKSIEDSFHINHINGKKIMTYLISPLRGGLVCNACQKPGEYYIKLRSDRLATINRLQTSSLAEAAALTMSFDEAEEITELLSSFLRYQTGTKELKSLKFLEKLKKTKL